MIEVPTAEADGSVPFGLLYAASSAYRSGHNVRILDIAKENLTYSDIKEMIYEFSPDLIGLGGITSSYKNCKELTNNIKRDFREIPVVVGGVISSVSDLLLEKTGADFIVHGEGEISFPNLIDAIQTGGDFQKVKGISFLSGGKIYKTERQRQISNLDEIPIPEYSLLQMEKYISPIDDWIKNYFTDKRERHEILERLSGEQYYFPIMTSRGCTHKCIFCYRHQKGLRQHSVEYVVNTMKYLRDNYGVAIFQINDELTTANKKWVLEFCDTLVNERLGVFFIVLSSRVDNIDEEILVRLKKAGCLMINYGYESGSDNILKEIKKGVTREQALEAGLLTKKVGIKNVPEIIIGFPSENERTVNETIDFLKQLDTWPISINTPIPFPKTPLWDYGVTHGLIKDKEEFVLRYKRQMFVNFTGMSNNRVRRLRNKARFDTRLHWLKKRKKYPEYLRCLLEKFFVMMLQPALPDSFYQTLRKGYLKLAAN